VSSFACPHCGADVPVARKSCPSCGASDSDGWGEEDSDLDDSEFDYEDYVQREFGQSREILDPLSPEQLRARRIRFVIWALIASLLLTVLLPSLL